METFFFFYWNAASFRTAQSNNFFLGGARVERWPEFGCAFRVCVSVCVCACAPMASAAIANAQVKAVLRALQSGDTNVDFTHLYASGMDVRQCRSDFEQVGSVLKQLITLRGHEDAAQPGSGPGDALLLSTVKLYEAAWQGLLLSHAESENLFTLKERLDVCVSSCVRGSHHCAPHHCACSPNQVLFSLRPADCARAGVSRSCATQQRTSRSWQLATFVLVVESTARSCRRRVVELVVHRAPIAPASLPCLVWRCAHIVCQATVLRRIFEDVSTGFVSLGRCVVAGMLMNVACVITCSQPPLDSSLSCPARTFSGSRDSTGCSRSSTFW